MGISVLSGGRVWQPARISGAVQSQYLAQIMAFVSCGDIFTQAGFSVFQAGTVLGGLGSGFLGDFGSSICFGFPGADGLAEDITIRPGLGVGGDLHAQVGLDVFEAGGLDGEGEAQGGEYDEGAGEGVAGCG